MGAERDRIVDEAGVKEMATFLDTENIVLPTVPHEVSSLFWGFSSAQPLSIVDQHIYVLRCGRSLLYFPASTALRAPIYLMPMIRAGACKSKLDVSPLQNRLMHLFRVPHLRYENGNSNQHNNSRPLLVSVRVNYCTFGTKRGVGRALVVSARNPLVPHGDLEKMYTSIYVNRRRSLLFGS